MEQNKNYATVSEFQARNSEPAMPIQLYLKTREFDPESVRVMGIAFECARAALHISTDDSMTEAVATRIIELAEPESAIPISCAISRSPPSRRLHPLRARIVDSDRPDPTLH